MEKMTINCIDPMIIVLPIVNLIIAGSSLKIYLLGAAFDIMYQLLVN